jgi:predicted CoA-binding protein
MPIEDEETIREILTAARTIAVVGASEKPWRDSNSIMQYLMNRGYKVYPVNPAYKTIFGERCYPDVASIPEAVDIVDVFRNPDGVPEVVDDAIAAKAATLWLQLGVVHPEAAKKAEAHGLRVVMDHCIAVDHRRLIR